MLTLLPADPGLRAELSLEPTTLPMGEPVMIRLNLHPDSSLVGHGKILNQNDGAWTCSFVFRDVVSGVSYNRLPYDVGMPLGHSRKLFIALDSGTPISEEMRVHLLSNDGEQIPPGQYEVHAIYENVGMSAAFTYRDSVAHPDEGIHPAPSRLWTGTIESDPVAVEILYTESDPTELRIPAGVTFKDFEELSQIAVYWDFASVTSVTVMRRPGFAIGHRYHARLLIDGEESDYHPRGLGGRRWSYSGTALMIQPDISRRAFDGATLELTIHIEVFESSVPGQHLWSPESGDFKILWADTIEAAYP